MTVGRLRMGSLCVNRLVLRECRSLSRIRVLGDGPFVHPGQAFLLAALRLRCAGTGFNAVQRIGNKLAARPVRLRFLRAVACEDYIIIDVLTRSKAGGRRGPFCQRLAHDDMTGGQVGRGLQGSRMYVNLVRPTAL